MEGDAIIEYGFTKELDIPFSKAVDKVIDTLKKEDFGILTRIDVEDKFKEKLGIDFKKYVILGACHPESAHDAIIAEENVGLLLPCNVIVYESGDKTVISVIKPTVAMSMINNKELKQIAKKIEKKLEHVIYALK